MGSKDLRRVVGFILLRLISCWHVAWMKAHAVLPANIVRSMSMPLRFVKWLGNPSRVSAAQWHCGRRVLHVRPQVAGCRGSDIMPSIRRITPNIHLKLALRMRWPGHDSGKGYPRGVAVYYCKPVELNDRLGSQGWQEVLAGIRVVFLHGLPNA